MKRDSYCKIFFGVIKTIDSTTLARLFESLNTEVVKRGERHNSKFEGIIRNMANVADENKVRLHDIRVFTFLGLVKP